MPSELSRSIARKSYEVLKFSRFIMIKLAIGLIAISILKTLICEGQELKNHIVADPNGIYHIFWEADDKNITFQLEVKTKGYMGFGFSPNGGMPGSDVIIGWVLPNGTAVFCDRHAVAFAEPLNDTQQNYELLNAYENETHTILRFTRELNTCDKENDTIITDDTQKIIYSWHPDDPKDITGLPYHGPDRRGSRSELLLSPQPPLIEVTNDIYVWDIQLPNLTIPVQVTTYWCITVKVPDFDEPHDYIGYTVHIKPGNEAVVHHFFVRICKENTGQHAEEVANLPRGFECVLEDTMTETTDCEPPLNVWVVGSDGQRFPDGVGFTLGEKFGGPSYLLVQMHYTNNDLKSGIVDDSIIRYYLKKKVQPIQATMLQVHYQFDYSLVIPPGQPEFPVTVFCPSECTKSAFPPEGITIFAVGLHTHLIGRKLILRHFRGNQELKPITSDEHFDFNYQSMRQLREPVIVLPGDMLMGICAYSSIDKNQTTIGGISTFQEMCYFYLSYYPATPLTSCISSPEYQKIYDFFGVEVGPDRVQVVSPPSLYNRSFFDVARQYDWATGGQMKLSEMSSMQYEGAKKVECKHQTKPEMNKNITISYPMNATFYVVTTDVCAANKTTVSATYVTDVMQETKPMPKTYNEETKGYEPTTDPKPYY